jgi:hypothetical protein
MPRSDLLRAGVAATALFLLAAMASVASGSGRAAPDSPPSILIRGDVSALQRACVVAGTGTARSGGGPSGCESASTTSVGRTRAEGSTATSASRRWSASHHWVTARGLRLSDPSRKLYVLYSPRRFTGSWAWLLTRYSRIGLGAYYPGLAAKIDDGWVTAFRIRYRAGGD